MGVGVVGSGVGVGVGVGVGGVGVAENDIRLHPMSVTPSPSLDQATRWFGFCVGAGTFPLPQRYCYILFTHASIDPPPVGRRRALAPGQWEIETRYSRIRNLGNSLR